MNVTARGVAVFSGGILAAVAVCGVLIDRQGPWALDFLLASWLPRIVLWPGAALASALDGSSSRRVASQAAVLWPAYAGVALYGLVVGHWWMAGPARGVDENYAEVLMLAVMAVHAAVFVLSGAVFALFPSTRPAGFQLWLGYLLLISSWVAGGIVV
jgi:hypothetical protein